MLKSIDRPPDTDFVIPAIHALGVPEWNKYPPQDGHFSIKCTNGYLYINPRQIQIGSRSPITADGSGYVYNLLLKERIPDKHIKDVVEKYDIYIDFGNLTYTKPMNLFFLYFMEELLGPIVEYQAPFFDFGEPRPHVPEDIDVYRKMEKDNDTFWTYLFKQIKLVSRKQEDPEETLTKLISNTTTGAGRKTKRNKRKLK